MESSPPPGHSPSWDEKLDQLQRYLPYHLTDKILAHRGRLAGERKLVTVLFANLVGYTVYPGVAEIPADAWIAESIPTKS